MKPEKEETQKPPYVAFRTFVNTINKLHEKSVPSKIDKSVFSGQSGSGIAAIMAAYKYFSLVLPNGHPTERLKKLASVDEKARAPMMKEMIETSYPFLSHDGLDLMKATTGQVEEAFRKQGISGSTITKAMSFFLSAASAAGIPISTYIKAPPLAKSNGNRAKPRKAAKQNGLRDVAPPLPPVEQIQKSPAELLLGKFPDFDPEWDDELKKKWFESFSTLQSAMIKGDKT